MKKKILCLVLVIFALMSAIPTNYALAWDAQEVYEHNREIFETQPTDGLTLEKYKLPTKKTWNSSMAIQSDDEGIIRMAQEITQGMSSEYDMAKAIHDWVADNIYYDYDAYNHILDVLSKDNVSFNREKYGYFSAVETLEKKHGVCEGYANLTAALLRAVGIPAKYVVGRTAAADGNEAKASHAWCEAFVGGKWIIIDTTWDSWNSYEKGEFSHKPFKNKYFDISLKDISADHKYGDNSFRFAVFDYSGLTSLVIPDGLVSIGDAALKNCENLTSVTIPDSVTSIGNMAFYFCKSLASITFPKNLTSIGDNAFTKCESFTTITIPKNATSIGNHTFSLCKSLASITIPNGVTSIGKKAFYRCDSLVSIALPSGIAIINQGMFDGCKSLTSVTIPNGIVTIDMDAFTRCVSLKSVTIPDSVTAIEARAFSACESLTSIYIPETTTSIDDSAFFGDYNTTIYGKVGSSAERYAKKFGFKFVEGNIPTPKYTANPTSAAVIFNGRKIEFDAYNIAGSNYFKLRDLAFVLSGTEKQFDVGYDASKNAISLTSGRPYTIVGGEMSGKGSGSKSANPTASKIYLDGDEVQFTAYNIGGNNYFKLRDVMRTFDVFVGWDDPTKTITLDTSGTYSD